MVLFTAQPTPCHRVAGCSPWWRKGWCCSRACQLPTEWARPRVSNRPTTNTSTTTSCASSADAENPQPSYQRRTFTSSSYHLRNRRLSSTKSALSWKRVNHCLHSAHAGSKMEKAIFGSALSVINPINRDIDPPSHFWSSGHGPGLVIFLYCQGPCLSPRRHGILQGISIAHERPCCHSN